MECIIFDLDGTLWDSTQAAAIVWQKVASGHKEVKDCVTPDKLKRLYGLLLEEIAVQLFVSVPKEKAISVMEECVTAQNPYLTEHGGILLGDVEDTLRTLSNQYKLMIVSNCKSGYIEAFLKAHHLEQYITDHLCPGDTNQLKADNIRTIINRHQIKSAVYVGDTIGDEKAAHQAGIPFIYAAYGFGKSEQFEYEIHDITELVPVMEEIKKNEG